MAQDLMYYFDKKSPYQRHELGEIQTDFNMSLTIDGEKDSMQVQVFNFNESEITPNTILYHLGTQTWWVVSNDNIEKYESVHGRIPDSMNENNYNTIMAKRLYIQLYNAKTGESITLPLNPETTDITNEKDVKTYNILGYGEVSIGGNKLLKRLTLSNIFPDNDTYFALLASLVKQLNYKPYSLQETVDMINRWVDNNEIIRVIISGHLNAEFRIQSHTSHVRESISDLGYTLELVEYRNPEKEKDVELTVSAKIVNLKERAIKKYIPAQITGQTGQTIYKLAKLTYGGRWQELRDKNAGIGANVNLAGKIVEMLPL